MPDPQEEPEQPDPSLSEHEGYEEFYETALDDDERMNWLDDLLDGEEDRLAEARDEIRRSTR